MSPLPDYLAPITEAEILERLLSYVPAHLDKSEGSYIFDALAPVALELALHDDRLILLMEWSFASTTFGEFLDKRVEEHGLLRRAAVPSSIAEQEFTGTIGTIIPAGFEVSTPATEGVPSQIYATDEELVIGGGGTIVGSVTAVAGGAEGNVGVGAVSLVVAPLPGLDSTVNLSAGLGGLDEETDEELQARYLLRVRNPGGSGNQADYLNWALEVAGVGAVAVIPLEDGPGTVTVAILDLAKDPAGGALVDEVQEYIAPDGLPDGTGKAPIGAAVTVEAGVAVAINVNADLTIDAGYVVGDVQAEAEANISAYLDSIAFTADNDVRHARIVTAILDTPGIVDATAVTLNGGGANVAIGAKEVGRLGATVWS